MNAVDIASLLGEFDDKELALAFRLIPKEKAADVFANMESSLQSVLVESPLRKRTERNPGRSVPWNDTDGSVRRTSSQSGYPDS